MKFALAAIASAVLVLSAPFIGQLQTFLRQSLSTRNYVLLFGAGILGAVGLAVVLAITRIRDRRAQRFGLMAIALLIGGAYMWWTATPYPEINAVERVHFVQYGLIALLFYRAFRFAGDPSMLSLPLLAAFSVGTLDEWLQWFIPYRVGEAHDVFINLAAIVCGLLFALAILPPKHFSARLQPASWRRLGMVATVVWLIFAGFVGSVHLGYDNDVPGIGRFKSHYSPNELDSMQAHRAELWKSHPPIAIRRLSREDQYLDEGLWHVRRRNGAADVTEAWRENLILERFFTPVLDLPTYAAPAGTRWPPEQRADFAARADANAAFVSAAEAYPIYAWPVAAFWVVVASVAMVLLAAPLLLARRGRSQ